MSGIAFLFIFISFVALMAFVCWASHKMEEARERRENGGAKTEKKQLLGVTK